MRVSQRLDHTLRLVTALARLPEGTVVAAGELAASLGLPARFAEQHMTALGHAGLVRSRRGAGGGVSLARPATSVTVLDVVHALEGRALDVPLVRHSAVTEFWSETAESLERILGATTIAALAERQAALDAERSPMYFI